MVTLPRDSVILYATLVISFWISSEWYFLPMTALRPVTVFLMLEVICHQASAAEEGALRSSGRVLRAHPAQCGLAVLPLLVGEAHHAPGWIWGLRVEPWPLKRRRPQPSWVLVRSSSRSGPLGHLVCQHVDAAATRNGHDCRGAEGLSGTQARQPGARR